MTNYESKALEVLLAHQKTRDPFGGPVQAVGMSLGLPTAEARTFVEGMVKNGLVKITMEASNFAEVGQVLGAWQE